MTIASNRKKKKFFLTKNLKSWVIPNSLLVGAFPRSKNLETILPLGITKFICLMEEHEIKKNGDYFNYNILKNAKNAKIYSFEHFPIPGFSKIHLFFNQIFIKKIIAF